MTDEIAQKLLNLTAEGYKKISKPFSDTRNRIWTDCRAFEGIVKMGDRVLDAGCGNGKLITWLTERGIASYTGIDLNPNFVRIASEKYPSEKFYEGDLLTPGLHPALKGVSFDVVLCIAVLHHLPSEALRIRALRNLRVRLSNGGVLCMTNWNLFQVFGASKSVWKNFRNQKNNGEFSGLSWRDLLTHWKSGGLDEILYYYAFTPSEITRLCKKAGFKTSHSWYSSNGDKKHWWDGRNIMTIAYA